MNTIHPEITKTAQVDFNKDGVQDTLSITFAGDLHHAHLTVNVTDGESGESTKVAEKHGSTVNVIDEGIEFSGAYNGHDGLYTVIMADTDGPKLEHSFSFISEIGMEDIPKLHFPNTETEITNEVPLTEQH